MRLWLFLFVVISSGPLLAQDRYMFIPEYVTTKNGLTDNKITSIIQDSAQFVWIATSNGLNRYDGSFVKSFKYDPFSSNSLSYDDIHKLFLDSQNRIWVTTRNADVNLIDKTRKRISRIPVVYDTLTGKTVTTDLLLQINQLPDGQIYMWSNYDLYLLNEREMRFERRSVLKSDSYYELEFIDSVFYSVSFSNTFKKIDNKLTQIANLTFPEAFDSLNPVSFVHTMGSSIVMIQNRLVLFYDIYTKEIQSFTHLSRITAAEVIKNNLIIADEMGGLHEVKLRDKHIQREQLYRHPESSSVTNIQKIVQLTNGDFLLGTETKGLSLLKKKSMFINRITKREGFLFNESIRSIWFDGEDSLYIGGYNGFERIIKQRDETSFRKKSEILYDIQDVGVPYTMIQHPILPDVIIVGTEGRGLYVFNKKTKEMRPLEFEGSSFVHPFISHLIIVRDRFLIANANLYVFVIDLKENTLLEDLTNRFRDLELVFDMHKLDNTIALLTKKGEMKLYDEEFTLISVTSVLDSTAQYTARLNSVLKTPSGEYYFASNRGLIFIDKKGNRQFFNEKDGLPNSTINSIQFDAFDNLWVSTNYGLAIRKKGSTQFVSFINENELQQLEFNRHAFNKTKNGFLYFGGLGGINEINPARYILKEFGSEVFVDQIQSNLTTLFSPNDTVNNRYVFEAGTNQITLSLTAPDFSTSGTKPLYFKIEGIMNEWQRNSDFRLVQLNGLSKGEHEIQLAKSSDTPETGALYKTVSVEIRPFFYETWLFKMGSLSILFLIVIYFVRQKVKQIKYETSVQKAYTQKVLTVQEQERKRIALALHDSIGNQLLLVKLQLNAFLGVEKQQIMPIISSLDESIQEVRKISHDLHPHLLEKIGLTVSIKALIESFSKVSSIEFRTHLDSVDAYISKENSLIVYRFIQESINNVIKYSNSHKVSMFLYVENNQIQFILEEAGSGYDYNKIMLESNGMAFKSLRERAEMLKGKLRIHSIPNEVTRIELSIPVKK